MKIGFIQSFPKFGEKERNVRGAVERMSEVEADLVVLPELFNSGYLFRSVQELEELSEEIPEGFTTQTLMEIARKRSTYVVGGLPERAGKIFYNSAVLVGPEGFIDLYRKAHLFADEPKWFEKGDTPFRVHDIGLARVGVLICFDWIFPEAARTLALRGADIICHPSNLVLPYCQKAMVTRSLENGLFSITCNRIGAEERGGQRLEFTGSSQIVGPKGSLLASASRDREESKVVEIDPQVAREKRVGQNEIFRERRRDLYELDS